MRSQVTFFSQSIERAFRKLAHGDGHERQLYRELKRVMKELESDAYAGKRIQKRLIPRQWKTKNLWKYNLPEGWRLLYSISAEQVVIYCIILGWMDHKRYERRFKY